MGLVFTNSIPINFSKQGGGTTNYEELSNKPSINGVTLQGNLTSADLNLSAVEVYYE